MSFYIDKKLVKILTNKNFWLVLFDSFYYFFYVMSESLQGREIHESGVNLIDSTKKSLSLLEKETWIKFFKDASNWIKGLFCGDVTDNGEGDNKTWSSIGALQESQTSSIDNNFDAYSNVHLDNAKVNETWNYIANWWTFYSGSKWRVTRGRNKYKQVCSTWSYNVLWKLWLPKVSNSTECDLKWKVLPKMGLEYIWEVDPDNPGKNWYKPQNGDTAVWPRFNNGRKMTQHQATFINWHWVSDTIQNKMSCYGAKNEPMVKVYRYTWKTS